MYSYCYYQSPQVPPSGPKTHAVPWQQLDPPQLASHNITYIENVHRRVSRCKLPLQGGAVAWNRANYLRFLRLRPMAVFRVPHSSLVTQSNVMCTGGWLIHPQQANSCTVLMFDLPDFDLSVPCILPLLKGYAPLHTTHTIQLFLTGYPSVFNSTMRAVLCILALLGVSAAFAADSKGPSTWLSDYITPSKASAMSGYYEEVGWTCMW